MHFSLCLGFVIDQNVPGLGYLVEINSWFSDDSHIYCRYGASYFKHPLYMLA